MFRSGTQWLSRRGKHAGQFIHTTPSAAKCRTRNGRLAYGDTSPFCPIGSIKAAVQAILMGCTQKFDSAARSVITPQFLSGAYATFRWDNDSMSAPVVRPFQLMRVWRKFCRQQSAVRRFPENWPERAVSVESAKPTLVEREHVAIVLQPQLTTGCTVGAARHRAGTYCHKPDMTGSGRSTIRHGHGRWREADCR
jgi:hypothetical protein